MGCGCGRKRVSRAERLKKNQRKVSKDRRANLKTSVKFSAIISPLTSKSPICMSCPETKQSPEERKKGIRVCHKTNRLINNIVRDSRFSCPLGKWKNTK